MFGKVLKNELQKKFHALLIGKYQEQVDPKFKENDLLSLFLDHAMSESARSIKNESIL